MKLSVSPTTHCEQCYDTIANHIDKCPVCGLEHSKIDKPYDIEEETEITCLNCKTTFVKVNGIWFDDAEVIIKTLP